MIDDLQIIQDKISEISSDLDGAYFIHVNQDNIKNIRTNIIDVLVDAADYLNSVYSEMTPWQKEHIVEALNALYWDWLHRALNSIRLALADPSTISPDNKYRDEIIGLSNNDLFRYIEKTKKLLDINNTNGI